MKHKILFSSFVLAAAGSGAQTNYLDNYLSGTVTYSVIAGASEQISLPRDLDFKPNSNELWVANKGSGGGARVIIYNAGLPNQTSQRRMDSHRSHFDNNTSAIAMGDFGEWANASEYNSSSNCFIGPSLWSSDTAIYARVFQNNWVSGLPLGSHHDMLHQSPYTMGIAHDNGEAYWVFDGYNGNICKYDYVNDHSPGYDDHSAGKIWRYSGVTVTRVPNVPSHMVKDKSSGWLYFIDGGPKKLRRLNTNTGSSTGNLQSASCASETLAGYYNMGSSATVETVETYATQPCGVEYYNNRLIVSDYTNGNITIYNTTTNPITKLGTIATGQSGIMGVKVGPDGKIWFVNYTANTVVRMHPASPSADDAGIQSISSPVLTSYETNFFSPQFNVCGSEVSPAVTLLNSGSNTLSSVTINYKIDNGPVSTFNWTGSLAATASVSVTLPAIAVSPGTHKLTVYTSSPNGNPDPNPGNDTREGSFRAVSLAPFPFTEGFTATTFPPAGWDVMGFNRYSFMSRIGTVGGFGTNTGSAKMTIHIPLSEDNSGQIDYLMTPQIDLTTAPPDATFEFSVAHAQYSSSRNENLKVQVSVNCGNTWTTIYNKSGSTLATAPVSSSAFTPGASQWRKESISLTSYVGQPAVFMFVTQAANGNNIYLDDIKVSSLTTDIAAIKNDLGAAISVYPNPVSDKINISGTSGLLNNSTISLRNILGEEVLNVKNENSNLAELNVAEYVNGVYFLSVQTAFGNAVKKIVISR